MTAAREGGFGMSTFQHARTEAERRAEVCVCECVCEWEGWKVGKARNVLCSRCPRTFHSFGGDMSQFSYKQNWYEETNILCLANLVTHPTHIHTHTHRNTRTRPYSDPHTALPRSTHVVLAQPVITEVLYVCMCVCVCVCLEGGLAQSTQALVCFMLSLLSQSSLPAGG